MTNYSRGRAREYKTMQLLRAGGFVVSRSAMSHGPVDIFAAKAGKILLVQVKSGSAKAKKDELEMLKKWAVAFDAEAQVWSFKKRGNLVKVTVRAAPGTKKIPKKKVRKRSISVLDKTAETGDSLRSTVADSLSSEGVGVIAELKGYSGGSTSHSLVSTDVRQIPPQPLSVS